MLYQPSTDVGVRVFFAAGKRTLVIQIQLPPRCVLKAGSSTRQSRMLLHWPQKRRKKDAHQTWRPSVAAFGLRIVLSILSLTYGNFAFNSKTLPIFSQFLPKILSCIRREKQIQYFQGILLGKPPENGTQRCYSLFPQAVIGAEADIPDMRVERFNDLLHIFQLLWG